MTKKLTKIVLIVMLIVVGFHSSGVEMGFCDDAGGGILGQAHGCVNCQPSHHDFIAQQTVVGFQNPIVTFLNRQQPTLPTAEPVSLFFRPPIFA